MDVQNAIDILQLAILQQLQMEVEFEDQRRNMRPKRFWVRPWLSARSRLELGHYHRLMRELNMEGTISFFNYLRMQPAMFDEILNRVGPRIQKKDTNLGKCLDPGLKLAITIRHLASGDKYPTLQYDFRVARNTICIIIPEVCRAIVLEYKNELIPCPSSPEQKNKVQLQKNSREGGTCLMHVGLLMGNMWPSDVLPELGHCITTTKASSLWY